MCVHVFIHKTPAIDMLNGIHKHTIHMPYTGSMHVTYVHVHPHSTVSIMYTYAVVPLFCCQNIFVVA